MQKNIIHPLTGVPIHPLGFRKDGRAIWPIMGAEDDSAAVAAAAAQAAEDAKTVEAAQATEAAAAAKAAEEAKAAESLGDAGKKALDAMKLERKTAKDEATKAKADLAALQAKLDGKEAEHKAEQEAQKVKDEALSAANERILKAEVRAAAAAKLQDPKDALLHIDLSPFEVGEDGEVDSSAIAQAIDDLVAAKPYLAAQGGSKFKGSGDGGARNGQSASPLDDQIAEAEKSRDFQTVIALKQQRAAELKDKK